MIFVDTRLYGAPVFADPILENNTWKTISKISQKGEGANYWAVGDKKNVHVIGPVGQVQLDNVFQVFIIGFDHNKDLEGAGITFQCFKNDRQDEDDDTDDVVLSYYEPDIPTGLPFSMNHDSATILGGWKGCDLRYDVLGSTDTPNGDASEETAKSPVPNTLMAALPSDLRIVMRPLSVWSNNPPSTDRDVVHTDPNSVTATVDYLPFMSAYEIGGDNEEILRKDNINEAEITKQAQYKYYADGGSIIRCAYSDYSYNLNFYSNWWTRSVFAISPNFGAFVNVTDDLKGAMTSNKICGMSPIFRV